MKVYRNIYLKSHLPKFSGRELLFYYGKVVTNADNNGSLTREFDRSQDLYIGCDCDAPKYSGIVKKPKPQINNQNIKDSLEKNYGKKCRGCKARRF